MYERIDLEKHRMSARETSPDPTKDMVFRAARDVFGDTQKAYSWMNTQNSLFDGMKPVDFIQYGSEEDLNLVLDELGRIEQGIF